MGSRRRLYEDELIALNTLGYVQLRLTGSALMIRWMTLTVVAEGVEELAQFVWLTAEMLDLPRVPTPGRCPPPTPARSCVRSRRIGRITPR